MLTGNNKILYDRITNVIDPKRILHDPLYTLALGTDASFYRLIPKMVIRTINEDEVSLILRECHDLQIAVTFRAAGTSLSGQAITDSVLVIAGSHWKNYSIGKEGNEIRLQPGLTGARVNSLLAPFGRKIGPDPASINSAMIGGIAANNASGMCCGTAENSYKTVAGMRIILADGSVLDTRDQLSKAKFAGTHATLIKGIDALASKAKQNSILAEKISRKYKMKNTTGYSLNALTDFTDPFDIIEHLIIGSEGTLGFISEITYKTVVEHPFKASSLMIFPDIKNACNAVTVLKSTPVSAVELIDRAGLRSVENEPGMPSFIKTFNENVCALLVETVAPSAEKLNSNYRTILQSIRDIPTERPVEFTSVRLKYERLWKIRKGLFPSVGAMRRTGTTVIIEDVAFPVARLAEATLDLQKLLQKYGYTEAVIFGHALEGNLHFVFTQDFSTPKEVERYRMLIEEVSDLVVHKYDGSLKAEHGTGRNMAPFVELEWGKEAFQLMNEIKDMFDPLHILNPGVILNSDPDSHIKDLKPLPAANEIIDKCTECGFCEPSCVSADMTLTPRQRIAVYREMTALSDSGREPHILSSLNKSYKYAGDATCATDGLCALNCPVKIDTGKLIKNLRTERIGKNQHRAWAIAGRMALVTNLAGKALSFINFFHKILGSRLMNAVAAGIRKISGNTIPAWNKYMPSGSKRINVNHEKISSGLRKVVYFPSCINRTMGVSPDYKDDVQLSEKMVHLLHKGGFEVIYPENLNNLCCGMAFLSKGYSEAGEKKSAELEAALIKASGNGQYPVLCDMSPCLYTMRENMKSGLKLYEPAEFILEYLIPRLDIVPSDETISIFPVCSMKKMGLDNKLFELARICTREVIVAEANCCGFAGDRGFTYPELNRHGLRNLKVQLSSDIVHGYSTSRTCEIGLSHHSGISYKSIVYLVDQVSSPRDINK